MKFLLNRSIIHVVVLYSKTRNFVANCFFWEIQNLMYSQNAGLRPAMLAIAVSVRRGF